jgi:hypothetical protein
MLALAQLVVDIAIFGMPVLLRQLIPRRQKVLVRSGWPSLTTTRGCHVAVALAA